MNLKSKIKEKAAALAPRLKLSTTAFFKWLFCSVLLGILMGFAGSGFYYALNIVTDFRISHWYLLLLLPFAGLFVVWMYHLAHEETNIGTNLVIEAIQSNEDIPLHIAPLIFIATLVSHIFGASAGREGAALQMGGSVGNAVGKLLHFDDKDTRILIMCGMSACFSALFGTPAAAAIFSMEVISVGVMYYAALVPCVLSSLIARYIAILLKVPASHFSLGSIPDMDVLSGLKMILLGIAFACASILFCLALRKAAEFYGHLFKSSYQRILLAGLLVILLRYLTGTTDYLGAGGDVIARSFLMQSVWYAFLLKILFTAISLGGGYKGGEIVPSLFIGATLGSFLGAVLGLPVPICAACGMVSVFCGVTNCPLTSLIMAVEMFGAGSLHYYLICIAISYLLSGYYSLYKSQKIVYSKYKTVFINRKTH